MLSGLQSLRRGVLAATACVALLGATASAAQSEAPPAERPPACPPPYVTWTLEEGLVRYAGFYTEEEIRAGFAEHDGNGNGIICALRPADDRFYPLQYFLDDFVLDDFQP